MPGENLNVRWSGVEPPSQREPELQESHAPSKAAEDRASPPDLVEAAPASQVHQPAHLNGAHPHNPAQTEADRIESRGLDLSRLHLTITEDDLAARRLELIPSPLYTRLLELHNLILRAELGRGSLAEAEQLCAALVEEERP